MEDLVAASGERVTSAFRREALFLGSLWVPGNTFAEELNVTKGRESALLGWIAPITKADQGKVTLLNDFGKWRQSHEYAYPTRFPVTLEGTRNWLGALLESGSRILFLLTDVEDRRIGHIGLAWNYDTSRIEIDSVLRGETAPSGFMAAAMSWVEDYAYKEFNCQEVDLRVLESNKHAIGFYSRLKYSPTLKTPLEISYFDEVAKQQVTIQDALITMTKNLEHSRGVPELILTAGPSIGFREKHYVADALANGWNANHSKYLTTFQSDFTAFTGASHALATSSCTGALHLALAAIGVGPGDEVIVPALTWVATASAVAYTGATPVFSDVTSESWTADPASIRSLINSKTKAIIAVHLYGFAANMPVIRSLADEHGLFLIEDAAPAIGATIQGGQAGTFGHFGCYSFQGAKLLVTGEGGMLTTNSKELFERAVKLQEHGRRPGTFWIDELGYKYKMSNMTAALGLGQLHRASAQIEKKRRINDWYREFLASQERVRFQEDLPQAEGIAWMSSFYLEDGSEAERDELMSHLKKSGIDSRPVFPSLTLFEFWKTRHNSLPVSAQIGSSGINLPSGVMLSRNSVEKVSNAIMEFLE